MTYIEELAKALRHEDPELRVRVANALKELEDPRATMPLIEALDDEDEDVRRAVAWALSWVGDERARPNLINALEDRNDSVRLWCASGLQRIGDESAVEPLIQRLSDSYDRVREQAVEALAKIGDSRAIGPLVKVLEDEDSVVRSAALISLREGFGVEVSSDFEEATRQMKEQRCLNEKLEKVLNVISRMEKASGAVRDEELYRVLDSEYNIGEDEAIGLLVKLIKMGYVHWPQPGVTQICI